MICLVLAGSPNIWLNKSKTFRTKLLDLYFSSNLKTFPCFKILESTRPAYRSDPLHAYIPSKSVDQLYRVPQLRPKTHGKCFLFVWLVGWLVGLVWGFFVLFDCLFVCLFLVVVFFLLCKNLAPWTSSNSASDSRSLYYSQNWSETSPTPKTIRPRNFTAMPKAGQTMGHALLYT